MSATLLDHEQEVHRYFHEFIVDEKHPCVLAQTVFQLDRAHINVYDTMNNVMTSQQLLNDLNTYVNNYDFGSRDFESFVAVFIDESTESEEDYEQKLWSQLQLLHDLDECDWDVTVSADPSDPHFSFSLCGKAFFIVGMHPKASRKSRQTKYVTIVFNLHAQFELLRKMNVYDRVKSRIRKRDAALQGNINPVLQDFGTSSEALQYSGRHIDASWKCPFLSKAKA